MVFRNVSMVFFYVAVVFLHVAVVFLHVSMVFLLVPVVFLCVVVSGFFTILYSMEWGKKKSLEWLSTFVLSFFQSVIVVQPVKVQSSKLQLPLLIVLMVVSGLK